ncbi:hypothetical protein INR49_029558 [Caranx melampygus]|nr:hypothetical protein INR49_029558 [Caranx melampygus]
MNSILQVLSHLQKFRECFLTLDLCETEELLAKTNHSQGIKGVTGGVVSSDNKALSGCPLGRMGKTGCWNLPESKKESTPPSSQAAELVQPKESRCSTRQQMSLCHELHTLFRVMWSGRWSLVSPFAMLHSVWNLIPAFRGYDQQDAQEFLCELLDKVQQELDTEGSKRRIVIPITKRKLSKQVLKVLNTIFHGQLLSQVTCLSCKHKSNTVEPFWDLSLEFPERYHSIDKGSGSTAYQRSCTLTEMLSKFTEMEALEGSIYACNHCNRRNHREKIGVHVAFDQVLNIKPYCCTGSGHSVHRGGYTYDLSAVVMHHGKGFGSGHYTAYCYNTEGGFWVHCNDSEMKVCSVEELGSSHTSKKSHCFHRMNSSKVSRMVAATRARVFIKGVMKLAKVETKTSSTAISARMTLMSLPSRARALAFSTPSNWTTCCCCCCSSSLVMRALCHVGIVTLQLALHVLNGVLHVCLAGFDLLQTFK